MSTDASVQPSALEAGNNNKSTSPATTTTTASSAITTNNADGELTRRMEPMTIETAAATSDRTSSSSSSSSSKNTPIWDRLTSWIELYQITEKDNNRAPKLEYLELFKLFLSFGIRAFGGPMAQIEMMRTELVVDGKWITNERFRRVFSVYQVLPGPEATELACYFGYLSRGRIGSLIGGLGFILPGFLLMLLWSYIYVTFGIKSTIVQSSFHCVQIVVAAFIFRATYKLSESALMEEVVVQGKAPVKEFNWHKGFLCLFCFLTSIIGLNFFISLAVAGIMNNFYLSSYTYKYYFAYLTAAFTIGMYILFVHEQGIPSSSMIGGDLGSGSSTSYESLLQLGLIAGMVTFGGAYTTLPFIYTVAVQQGGWLSQAEFLDSIAITNVLPTPLVSFVTMVGFIGHGIGGALLMAFGIFLPAMSFTIIGHEYFEAAVDNKLVQPFLDGVAAAVIGLLIQTSFQFVQHVIKTGIDAFVFGMAFYCLFYFTNKFTQPIMVIVSALAGQILYPPGATVQL